ncbi:peptidylprolyl isomerase [Aliikangiella maris]|uniref:Peptidylprolyl isomerase n=2 Tax=Aliikangiella maris TaxID=3162458 RepID=A0ABV3MSL1_9GAMM
MCTFLNRICLLFFAALANNLLASESPNISFKDIPLDDSTVQQIYNQVDKRDASHEIFQQALAADDLTQQNAALLGLGRIGGKMAIAMVTPFLGADKPSLRKNAAFAIGISADKENAPLLWQQLAKETHPSVKSEIYLALGLLGPDQLVSQLLKQLPKEKNIELQGALFHGLGTAMVFNPQLKDDLSQVDFNSLLDRLAAQPEIANKIGLFINRVPEVAKYLSATKLLSLTKQKLTSQQIMVVARLINKVSENNSAQSQQTNRAFVAWLIEQSDSQDLGVQIAATQGLKNLIDFPQTLIQLGKLQLSHQPQLAHTALQVIAQSKIDSEKVMGLLKQQLKNDNPAMVVEAINGLISRQNKDKMSWIVKLIKHPSDYVKIRLLGALHNKSKTDFKKTIEFFTNDPSEAVANVAKSLLTDNQQEKVTTAVTPKFTEVRKVIDKKIVLSTTAGEITLALLPQAPYTSWHFVQYVNQGLYNGSYFSRVIGNFVAQGGDSIGNGEGSSNTTIREEISFLAHIPMTVGIATLGKDTGTSQFFINTARNLHLDRKYTIFATVIAGQENVYQLTNGAKIIEAKVVEAD